MRTIKVRKPTGNAEYHEMVKADEIVALCFAAVADGNETPQILGLLRWVCFDLGRMPTGQEFENYLIEHGAKIVPIKGQIEGFEN